jgi:hypothetical protein
MIKSALQRMGYLNFPSGISEDFSTFHLHRRNGIAPLFITLFLEMPP